MLKLKFDPKLDFQVDAINFVEDIFKDYTPDWAIVVERVQDSKKEEKIYFVVETKGTNNIYELKPEEKIKIKSAKRRFELIRDSKFVAPVKDFDTFESQW
uniref:Type III restriction enzyme C-terminal endonuclease domain-containing protein n=1 Tax=candidate division WOR-3 bacterium TaxID=2052148 RepID=A0A7C4YC20_UNCW3